MDAENTFFSHDRLLFALLVDRNLRSRAVEGTTDDGRDDVIRRQTENQAGDRQFV